MRTLFIGGTQDEKWLDVPATYHEKRGWKLPHEWRIAMIDNPTQRGWTLPQEWRVPQFPFAHRLQSDTPAAKVLDELYIYHRFEVSNHRVLHVYAIEELSLAAVFDRAVRHIEIYGMNR